MKTTIAVDIDDVIADTTTSVRMTANDLLGIDLQSEHYKVRGEYWGYYERVWRSHGISEDFSLEKLEESMVDDQAHVPVLAGASIALSELARNFKLVVITSRDPKWEQATKLWLNAHFGNIFEDILFARGKQNTSGRTKGQICKELGAKWLIDDNPEHCNSALNEGVGAVLFGQYGWHGTVSSAIVRCNDWPAVVEFFSGK